MISHDVKQMIPLSLLYVCVMYGLCVSRLRWRKPICVSHSIWKEWLEQVSSQHPICAPFTLQEYVKEYKKWGQSIRYSKIKTMLFNSVQDRFERGSLSVPTSPKSGTTLKLYPKPGQSSPPVQPGYLCSSTSTRLFSLCARPVLCLYPLVGVLLGVYQ